jgi:hypothetical protein
MDPHVRRGRKLDSHWPVRKQFDYTSWDWVEQKRGVYAIAPEVDDYIDSLIDNGVKIQVQLHYGNPMYTSPSGVRPDAITPEQGSFHNEDRSLYSVFWPPKSPDQIGAFIQYTKFVVTAIPAMEARSVVRVELEI